MKRIVGFILTGILCATLTGCIDNPSNISEKNTDSLSLDNTSVDLKQNNVSEGNIDGASFNNTTIDTNNNNISEVVEFSISNGNDIWEIGDVADKLFDGGGTREEDDEYVLYTYDYRMISVKKHDEKEVIRYISTKNSKDYTGRGVSVGNSLEELLNAYGNELALESEWNNYHLESDKYDKVYKYANKDENTQIIFSLKEDTIIMIQIATNQKQDNISLEL